MLEVSKTPSHTDLKCLSRMSLPTLGGPFSMQSSVLEILFIGFGCRWKNLRINPNAKRNGGSVNPMKLIRITQTNNNMTKISGNTHIERPTLF